MRKKLLVIMTIIGCFLLPGSCSIAPRMQFPQVSSQSFISGNTWSAEFYDKSSGRLILKTSGHKDTQKALDDMVQKNKHLKVVLYIEPNF